MAYIHWRWRVATTQQELDDAARIRWAVFGDQVRGEAGEEGGVPGGVGA